MGDKVLVTSKKWKWPKRKQIFIFSVLGIVGFILGYYEILTAPYDQFSIKNLVLDVQTQTNSYSWDKAFFIGGCLLLCIVLTFALNVIWDTFSKLNKWWKNQGKTDEVINEENNE